METRANYVLIGAFTLAVIAAAFGFVLWFQSLHSAKQRSPLRVVFEGPASGLRNGGNVNFNGIRIGEAIRATLQNVNRIVADNQQSVKNSLHNLETFTGALARNSEKIDNVMARVDGVMGKADSLMLGLNSIGGGATGGELAAMVKAIKELAEDFDKKSGALMADGRRTLADISRAVNNFDRNPSRVIFGGGNSAPAAEPAAPPRQAAPAAQPPRRTQ